MEQKQEIAEMHARVTQLSHLEGASPHTTRFSPARLTGERQTAQRPLVAGGVILHMRKTHDMQIVWLPLKRSCLSSVARPPPSNTAPNRGAIVLQKG